MDKKYWEEFYALQNAELKPSLFARYIESVLSDKHHDIIELGCGNGRDSVFFANKNYQVTAVDQCESEIKFMNSRYEKLKNLRFVCSDFTMLDSSNKYDVVYSRFTLHSINALQEEKVCRWTYDNLNNAGLFCIEVRGQKNEIYQLGEPVAEEPDAFVLNDHYRRFIHFDKFCSKLNQLGFHIDYGEEKKGFAPFKGEDETYIRIIASK